MLFDHMYKKIFPFKQFFGDSPVFLQQNQFLRGPTFLGSYKNQIFVSFSSLINGDAFGVPSKIAKRGKKSAEEIDIEKAYTVSYLINSCNLSPERAISASSIVRFKDSQKPNSVLAMLVNHGFSKTQIAIVVRKRPDILVYKEKTLLPKLQFFQSIGLSNALLPTIIVRQPTLLFRSLNNLIIPNYNYLKGVLLTDERVINAMKRAWWIFLYDAEKSLAPNINVLRELKVPESCIRLLLAHYPEALMLKNDEFKESVSKVLEMGFDQSKSVFVFALHAVSGESNKATWAQCYETYSDWGWTREDIYMAFKKDPNCMLMSHNNISRTMDYLVNKIGLNSRMIAACPTVLLFSLEKRIVPRYSVIQVLLSRGLLNKQMKSRAILLCVEKSFLDRFVFCYEKEVPKLYEFYQGKLYHIPLLLRSLVLILEG